MITRARVALLGGVVLTVVLIPAFLFLVLELVSDWTAGLQLKRREQGLLFGLAHLLTVPIAFLPAWIGCDLLPKKWSRCYESL
jgi:hypothetical protein